MSRVKIKPDSGGFEAVLKSAAVAAVVRAAADSVADGVSETAHNGDPIPVNVSEDTTDRARASVTMTHPAGIGIEAKRGSLKKAARATGLDVSGRGR